MHNCQTGRWLTILRAQWSLNIDYMPHFTVSGLFSPSHSSPNFSYFPRPYLKSLARHRQYETLIIFWVQVGNMKRTLDVVAGTGDKIVSLWTDE